MIAWMGTASSDVRPASRRRCGGIALVLTLLVLAILTVVIGILVSRIGIVKHRTQYMIDYQNARYACDSGMKYALAALVEMQVKLADRKDEPDFSDVFNMSTAEYKQFLVDWAQWKISQDQGAGLMADRSERSTSGGRADKDLMAKIGSFLGGLGGGSQDPNGMLGDDGSGSFGVSDMEYLMDDPNSLRVPGPYGPPWPYVVEPMEFEIGDAKVRIEICDENAKMPLVWAMTSDEEARRAAGDAIVLFCEWMQMTPDEIARLRAQLEVLAEKKAFTLTPAAATTTERVAAPTRAAPVASRSSRLRRSTREATGAAGTATTEVRAARSPLAATADFARLLHSSVVDLDMLARPIPDTGKRAESPMKYLGLWGSQQVNINTAPRHVLEAVFAFGGRQVEIADEIIKRRREKPFAAVGDLSRELYAYSTSIRKCEPYITTKSTFLSIHVTAYCGSARAQGVATVIKDGKQVQKIAVLGRT